MSHLNNEVSEATLQMWEEKRDDRYKAIELKRNTPASIIIN
jgi:hypothetical protein